MTYRFGRLPAILKHEWEWYQPDRFWEREGNQPQLSIVALDVWQRRSLTVLVHMMLAVLHRDFIRSILALYCGRRWLSSKGLLCLKLWELNYLWAFFVCREAANSLFKQGIVFLVAESKSAGPCLCWIRIRKNVLTLLTTPIKRLLTNSGIDSIYLMLTKIMAANHG